MITLNITIGGHLLIELDKGAKKELKELIEKASNTDAILTELLDRSGYLGNRYVETTGVLTEAPIIGFNPIYEEDEDFARDYEKVWYYGDYMLSSFAEVLLRDKKVIFKKA